MSPGPHSPPPGHGHSSDAEPLVPGAHMAAGLCPSEAAMKSREVVQGEVPRVGPRLVSPGSAAGL